MPIDVNYTTKLFLLQIFPIKITFWHILRVWSAFSTRTSLIIAAILVFCKKKIRTGYRHVGPPDLESLSQEEQHNPENPAHLGNPD